MLHNKQEFPLATGALSTAAQEMTGDEGLQLLETVPNGLCLLLRCRLLDPKLLCFFPSLDLKLPLVIKYPGISLENGSYELDPEIVRHLGLRLVRRPRRLRPKLVCFFASLGLELLFVIKHPGIALENGIHELEPEIVRHHVVIAVLLMEIQPECLSLLQRPLVGHHLHRPQLDRSRFFQDCGGKLCQCEDRPALNQGGTVESASEAKRRRKPTNLMILARSSPLARAVAPRIRINDGIGPKPPPPGEWLKRTVIITIVCIRYVIQPLIGMAVVHAAYGVGLLPHDPLYRYVLMMLFALPPAMNIGTMAQFVDLPDCCHCAYDVVDDIHVHPVLRLRVTIKKNRICGNIQLTDST
uniref:Uncharacterized protein n=1 Tax=Oryza nivara TaxID=4536 RepID=A0A0E0INF8_ORYNI